MMRLDSPCAKDCAQSSGLQASVRNAEQATNLIQTAEASLNEVNAILVRMRELAVRPPLAR